MAINIGGTHVYLSDGRRAVIVDQNEDGTYDAQVIYQEGIGEVVRSLTLDAGCTLCADAFDVSKMPMPRGLALPAKVGMFRKIINAVTFKKA
jgi:hypothetical protein